MEETTLEESLKVLRDQLEEMKDTQTVNKLDIINLSNEVDSLKLTSSKVTPETEKKIEEITQIAKKLEKFKKVDNLVKDIENLKKKSFGSSKAGYSATKELVGIDNKINSLEQSVNVLETKLSSMKPIRIPEKMKDLDKYSEMMSEVADKIDTLDAKIAQVDNLKRNIDNFEPTESKPRSGKITISEVKGLEDFMYDKFNEMNDVIKDAMEKNLELIHDMQIEIDNIKKQTSKLPYIEKKSKDFDMDEVKREFEKIKIKSEYIEEQLEKIDLRGINERIQELEHRLRTSNASSALVIE